MSGFFRFARNFFGAINATRGGLSLACFFCVRESIMDYYFWLGCVQPPSPQSDDELEHLVCSCILELHNREVARRNPHLKFVKRRVVD